MSSTALHILVTDMPTALFGVGLGGFGVAAHAYNPDLGIGSVVNNHYLETASELGSVGIILFAACCIIPLIALYRQRLWLGMALIVALISQWCFFSGYPNVLHIWCVLAVSYGATLLPARPPRRNQHNRVS